VNYKQGVTNEFRDQDATFSQRDLNDDTLNALVEANLLATVGRIGTQNVSGDLDYPDILALAARYDFSPRFALEVDGVWFGWSAFDEVVLDFELAPTETLKENYADKWQFRVGGEYTHSEQLRFMLGYVRDQTPQPKESMSPLLPDASRNDFSIGGTWMTSSGLDEITLGYMLVEFEERDTLENGVGKNFDGFDAAYKSRAHILSLAYSRRF
jgi:long-chain fatty acid transport protein